MTHQVSPVTPHRPALTQGQSSLSIIDHPFIPFSYKQPAALPVHHVPETEGRRHGATSRWVYSLHVSPLNWVTSVSAPEDPLFMAMLETKGVEVALKGTLSHLSNGR